MTTYYTYKKQVPLEPGQTVGYTPGKGYYAKGVPGPVYYTYKAQVPLEPGEVVAYTPGKGYYAKKKARKLMRIAVVGATLATAIAIAVAASTGGGGGGGGGGGDTTHGVGGGDPNPPIATTFVAQTVAGSGDGSSCGNARAATFYNTATNWGAGKTFAPGTVIGLCGTFTSDLTAQGSGTSGNPVTILFEPGAKVAEAVCDGCFNLASGLSWVTVDGGQNGQVEGTSNGTGLAHKAQAWAINASDCTNCTIKYLTIGPVFVNHPGDTTLDDQATRCLVYSGTNWVIQHNTMHDASWCLYEKETGSDANNVVENNDIYNIDHGWIITNEPPTGKLYFHGNHIHDTANWDDSCSSTCHHDGIHCFYGSGTGQAFTAVYIYDNLFDGNVGSFMTAWIYLESNDGSACSNSTSPWYIFDNVFSSTDEVPTNPYIDNGSGPWQAQTYSYSNTFSGPGAGHYGANQTACADSNTVFEDNAVGGCEQLIRSVSMSDYNSFANADTSGGNCFPTGGGTCSFATWQATGHDTHSVFNPAAATGSNTAGVGANLASLCTGDLTPLCQDIDGNPRPAVGPWDVGAYQAS